MQNIEDKLGSVFSKKNDIDSRLKTGSSSVLSQKIEFTAAAKPQSSMNEMLKDKYVNLAPSVKKSPSAVSLGDDGEGLPQPSQILFPPEKLNHNWKFQEGGAGLMNCGNTCFLNAVLQCLVHTPPLANYLMSGHHFSQCKVYSREKCIMCNLQLLMKRSLTGVADSFSPKWFINNLHFIGRHFRNGRQEDAHEFLRLSLEKMQKSALFGNNQLDKYSKETTVINQIFGGFLRSQVVCLRCKARSNTYDAMLDVSLDIKNVDSIERAFEQFVAPDKLDMDNAYKCDKCNQKVTALKRFSIHKPPSILTIQLKRFQFAQSSFFGGGGKISKHIKYPAKLNIRGYMSNKNGPPEMYSLFATIQHEGYSCQSGHYVANVRCGQRWYHFNDSMKRRTSLQQCLNESSAYVLFYIRDSNQQQSIPQNPSPKGQSELKSKHQNGHSSSSTPQQHKFIGPVKPHVIKTPEKSVSKHVNGVNGTPTNDMGTPVRPNAIPLSTCREKIRMNFGVKTPSKSPNTFHQKSNSTPSPQSKSDPPTPRLVMKIKDGKSITIETSPDGERRILSDDDEVIAKMNEKRSKKFSKKTRLVPYGDGSSSDSDWSSKASPKPNGHTNLKENGGVLFDQKLNTTTSVPGNNHLYETVTLKDKLSHTAHNNTERIKDMKIPQPKTGHSTPLKRHLSDRLGEINHNVPLKRQLSETLSCVTSPVSAKHTGTGEWQASVESVLSPSIGSSHSSTHSNNSTSDWSVSKKSKLSSISCPDRLNDGWTVTPSKSDGSLRKSLSETSVKSEQKGQSDGAEIKDHVGYVKSLTNMKRQVMQEQSKYDELIKVNNFTSPYVVSDDQKCLLNPDMVKDENSKEYRLFKKAKKHKKHKKRHQEEIDHNHKYAELKDESLENSSEHTHKKKKKKKHKHRDRDADREDGNSGHKHRDRDADRDDGNSGHKHRDRDADREVARHGQKHSDRDADREDARHGQKHRDRDADREDESRGHKQKLEREQPREEDVGIRSRRESESSTDYEWVEKKVENGPSRKTKSTPGTPCQSWDFHVKDGYRRSISGGNTPVKSSWDGLKASTVVNKLQNLSTYGYGAPVSTWDGSRSQMDVEKERVSRKRSSDDEYEEELDRGRVKKVKHKYENEQRYNGNMFQDEHEKRKKGKINWSSIKIGNNNPYGKQNGSASSNSHNRF